MDGYEVSSKKPGLYFGESLALGKVPYAHPDPIELPPRLIPAGLAISPPDERICADAQPVLDSETIERFCQIWAEVGRAILARRRSR